MFDKDTTEHTLEAEGATSHAPPAPPLPDEDYYRRGAAAPRAGRRASLGIALVLIGLILLAFQVSGGGLPSVGGNVGLIDRSLAGNRIELATTASDVEVRTWDRTDIRVEATQRGGALNDYTVNVTQSGATVRVSETRRSFFCLFCARSLAYRISLPRGAQADISTSSGEIDVEGLSGAVTLGTISGDVRADELRGGLTVETTSGEVRLNAIAGRLKVTTISGDVQLEDGNVDGAIVKTTSGEIELDGAAGALDLGSISGDITVRDARASRLTIGTTSGDITYEGELARSGTNQVSSLSGDITLRLPDDGNFRLDASTVSGDLQSAFDLSGGAAGRRTLSGVAGDGGATLNVNTTSGEISLEQR